MTTAAVNRGLDHDARPAATPPVSAGAELPDRPDRLPSPLARGDRLAPGYEVIEHVSRGEELDCYEAWSTDRYCRCFIKTLRPDFAVDQIAHRHLGRESDILLSLSHPHIVRAYEFVTQAHDEAPILVCENLPGATLGYILECEGRLGTADLANLGQHLCSALRYLHNRGYLHLDLKPSNIIATYGVTRLIDLSLARRPGRGRRGVGTLGYMSPEQVTGGAFRPATDVWGLGVVLYEAATGVRPFPGVAADEPAESALSRYAQQVVRRPPRIRARRRLAPDVADLLDSCLCPEPQDRPSLAAVADAMTVLGTEPMSGTAP